MEWKLELVPLPVSDVDRAKAFYTEKVGFDEDLDHRGGDEFRVVQLTPPGSACSIAIGTGVVDTPPGSVQGLQLVVPDVDAARAELLGRGVEVSEVRHFDGRDWSPGGGGGWNSFVFVSDPTATVGPYRRCLVASRPSKGEGEHGQSLYGTLDVA